MSYQDQSSLSEPLIPPNSASTPTSTPDDLANLRSSLTAFESLVQSIEEGLTGLENHGLTTQNWGSGNKNDRRGSMRETRGRIGGLIEDGGDRIPSIHTLFSTSSQSSASLQTAKSKALETASSIIQTGSPSRTFRAAHNEMRRDFQRLIQRYTLATTKFDDLEDVLNTASSSVRLSAASRGSGGSFVSLPPASFSGLDNSLDSNPNNSGVLNTKFQDNTNALVSERARDIEVIARNVGKVNEVYRDLANLVEEQGVEIDDIEQNIIMSRERTEKGKEQLRLATDFQKKSGKCAKVVIALVIVGACVGIGILYGGRIEDSFE